MVQIAIPYAYGTNSHTIRVRSYRTRIRVWYVPYAYGIKYSYGLQHGQLLYTTIAAQILGEVTLTNVVTLLLL